MAHDSTRIGIDVGGTKISGLALTPNGATLSHRRIATPQGDYGATVQAIVELISALTPPSDHPLPTVGLGIPGSLSPQSGLVRNANSTCLNGQDLKRDLERELGRSVHVGNDADCFALSEARDGAGSGHRTVWGIILGTGCGSGIVTNGRLLTGPRLIGGEWGHNPLPWMTEEEFTTAGPCWCGRRGCLETWLSGPALQDDHRRRSGQQCDTRKICAAAETGDPDARATLERHLSRLARSLAQVVNILDPDVIVMGGGLSQMTHIYDALPTAMAPHLFSDHKAVDIRPPLWGDDSGVRGAAYLGTAR